MGVAPRLARVAVLLTASEVSVPPSTASPSIVMFDEPGEASATVMSKVCEAPLRF